VRHDDARARDPRRPWRPARAAESPPRHLKSF
jgi:hypothetical protein